MDGRLKQQFTDELDAMFNTLVSASEVLESAASEYAARAAVDDVMEQYQLYERVFEKVILLTQGEYRNYVSNTHTQIKEFISKLMKMSGYDSLFDKFSVTSSQLKHIDEDVKHLADKIKRVHRHAEIKNDVRSFINDYSTSPKPSLDSLDLGGSKAMPNYTSQTYHSPGDRCRPRGSNQSRAASHVPSMRDEVRPTSRTESIFVQEWLRDHGQDPDNSRCLNERSRYADVRAMLPKPELIKFDGKEKTYPRFMNCFRANIDNVEMSCVKFKGFDVNERWKAAREASLCFRCLKSGHSFNKCTANLSCVQPGCRGNTHNTLLHRSYTGKSKYAGSANNNKSNGHHSACCVKEGVLCANKKVCLNVIPVRVAAGGKDTTTLALIDSGSDLTLCSDELLALLSVSGNKKEYSVTTVQEAGRIVGREVELSVGPARGDQLFRLPRVWTAPRLPSAECAADNEDLAKFSHLIDINLPDVELKTISLLIGSNHPELMCPIEIKSGKPGEPVGVLTCLGWGAYGPFYCDKVTNSRSHHVNLIQTDVKLENVNEFDSLQNSVERLWKQDVDDGHCLTNGPSVEDTRALAIMKSSIRLLENNHYEIALPWREECTELPNNYQMASKRLKSLANSLRKNVKLYDMYKTQITEYITKGYAQLCSEQHTSSKKVWYLPHHPVQNPNKPDKVRVVFDCAAVCSQISLNDWRRRWQ